MNIQSNETHPFIKKDIQLHKKSIHYLNEVFKQYETGDLMRDTVISDPIVHLYAEADTRNNEGELNGYNDSLFCKVYIFDPSNSIKYYAGVCDSVDVTNTGLWQVKVFKDGSTIMIFSGEHIFNKLTTLTVRKITE